MGKMADTKQTLSEFIKKLESLDIHLSLDGGKLKCKAPKGALSPDIMSAIKEKKDEIVSYLREKEDENIFFEPIPSVEKRDYYPLSAAQKRMFILNQIDKESTSYNLTQVLKIEGVFDKELFMDVFRQIAQRNESMRTSFKIIDGEPVSIIHDEVKLDAQYEEIDGAADIDAQVESFVRPYNLEKYPLFRLKILKVTTYGAEPVYYVIIDMHHIISDGVSMSILINEINALYAKKELPPHKKNYRDYAVWNEKLMAGSVIQKQKKFWLKQLEGEIPVLNLPTDFPRPEQFTFRGASENFHMESELAQKLYTLARDNRITLFSVLLAAYNVLLYKYTGQEDIIIGTSTAGRRNADLNDIIGVFINTVVLRNFPNSKKSFAEFAREVGANSLNAFDNQDYPFEKLAEDLSIRRDPSRNPLFDAMFILQNINLSELKVEGTRISFYDYKKHIAQFDISIIATQTKDGIDVEIEYCTDLFKKESIRRLGEHFINILEIAAGNPEIKLGAIDMLTVQEKHLLIDVYNDTAVEYQKEKFIHQLFEERAKENPDATALIFKNERISYGELNKKANSLAKVLIAKGVKKDSIVGLMVERSFKMIIGMLGVLKAGGAYLPVDPEFPADRVNYMLKDSGTRVLLSQKKYYKRLTEGRDDGEFDFEFVDMEDESNFENAGELPAVSCDPHALAYVIYTSGSTGKPKGVMLEHRSVVNFIKGVTDKIKFDKDSTILCLTTISFDIFVLETLLPLSVGMKIVIADENEQIDSKKLNDVIDKNNVDMLQATPSRLQLLIHGTSKLTCLSRLKAIMVGGEAFPLNLLNELKTLTKAKIYNMYGPTETTVWSTISELTQKTSIDIGRPIANTFVYILDKAGCMTAPGVAGELCIGGDGLARGYLNRPDLTNEKFLPDVFRGRGRMYKTGDLAKWRDDGIIECLGRIDQQVKIRGYRIELEEIEKRLSDFKGIKECVVAAKTDESGIKYLAAYYAAPDEIPVSELRNHLSVDLPDYMVPAVFVRIDKLPYTPNGKIDRKALPEPGASRPKLETEFKSAVSESEKTISHIWQNVLKREMVGVDDNFFELGGNSLTLIKMHEELDKVYPDKISVTDIFANPTIAKLARLIDGQKQDTGNKENISSADVSNDIAVIGMAGRFGEAANLREFWQGLLKGKDFVRPLPKERIKDCDAYIDAMTNAGLHDSEKNYFNAAFLDRIDSFDCELFNISPREAELMEPSQKIFLETAYAAVEDAGYGGKRIKGSNTGMFVGQSDDFGVNYKDYGRMVSTVNDQIAVSGNIKSIIASRMSYIFDLKGPSVTIDTACSSALVAVHAACNSLRNGECDMAIAGGCKVSIIPETNSSQQSNLGIESTSERSNTFDESADGMGYGEGCGAVVLKPLAQAQKDGDNIYAVIKGSAVNQDGASIGITAPNMSAQERVIQSAWKNAGINPETVTYIEAHGTGTKLGDPIEIAGITKAFRHYTDKKQFCAVASVKTNIGHTDNASGIASLIKAVLCLKNRTLPASIHFKKPNRQIDFINSPVYVADKTEKWESTFPRRCGVSSFGLSGTNCHMVLEEYDSDKSGAQSEKAQVLTLSAKNEKSLSDLAARYSAYLGESCDSIGDICFTANTGRDHYNYRLAIIADDIGELKRKTAIIGQKGLVNIPDDGIFFAKTKLISSEQQRRQPFEVTLSQIRELSAQAADIVGSLLDCGSSQYKNNLIALCKAYVSGADVDWEKLYSAEKHRKCSLPTYPFLTQRHWVEPDRIIRRAQTVSVQSEKSEQKEVTLTGRDSGVYSKTEKLIAGVFGKALGFDELNIYDNFFERGGNSLVAIRAEAYAEKCGLNFTSQDIYDHNTIEQLALFVDNKAQTEAAAQKAPEKETASESQSAVFIDNIEPFNDIFYRSCYFNSFFPVVNHFGKSILPYLANDTAVYKADAQNPINLDVLYIPFVPMKELIAREGLALEEQSFDGEILNRIKTEIRKKNPVIVWVDCFYESFRTDLFQKQHWSHTILIYGFDDSKKEFLVVEHNFRDSLTYEKRTIPYDDMFNMCKGYAENFLEIAKQPPLSIFSATQSGGTADYFEDYRRAFLSKKDLVRGGINSLKEFAAAFEKIIADEKEFFANGDKIIASLNAVMNSKEAEKYKLEHLCVGSLDKLCEVQSDLTAKWANIRRLTAKLFYSGVYAEKSVGRIIEKLKEACESETDYIDFLTDSLENAD